MKNLLFGGVRLNSAIGDFGLLALRMFAGLSLAYAHQGKSAATGGFHSNGAVDGHAR